MQPPPQEVQLSHHPGIIGEQAASRAVQHEHISSASLPRRAREALLECGEPLHKCVCAMWPLCFHLSQLSTYKHGDSQYLLILPPVGFFSLALVILMLSTMHL